ncbi:MAG TPA: tRNA glutamyl-Q(34) synthetase GluQRS [Aestuariivirgaceae bacterium]|jgi:glutamyl-Q tRNA(Asp) synthetase
MTPANYRFAPSPNGELHLGHAYSALFTQKEAQRDNGRFILRIEDIDTLRCRRHFAEQIFDDLAWLGLGWEEPVRFQSAHLADYALAQQHLIDMGLLYPCFCSRLRLRELPADRCDPDGAPLYPGTCRELASTARNRCIAQGMPFSQRIDMEKACRRLRSTISFHELGQGRSIEADPRRWGDVILIRKDIGTSYHIAVVVDDAIQSVTHVTRGMDLFEATHIHRLLQALLALPVPVYLHHRLIGDEQGRKLSKSAGDRSLRSLRQAGITAGEVRTALGF